MLLSRAGQYTLQALIFLARQPPRQRIVIKDMADQLGLPMSYLAKLIQAPTRAGWLDTARGRSGGIYLCADARDINLFDIFNLTDEHRLKRECLLGLKDCDDANGCVMHCNWKPIKQELAENLGKYSLAALTVDGMPDWLATTP